MNKLFQFMTAALLGLALIVPAAAQDGQRPKRDRGEKRPVDVTREPKGGDQRGRGNGNNGDRGNQDRGGRNGNGERGKDRGDKRGNRPNDDLHYDL
jgi:hypothetical protein